MASPVITNKRFPPSESDQKRLSNAKKFEKIYRGDHMEAFLSKAEQAEYLDEALKLRYIALNFAGLLSRTCADLIFGEPPQFSLSKAQSTGAKEQLKSLLEKSSINTRGYEAVLSASWRGDCLLRARYGKRYPWESDNNRSAIIESIPTDLFFPHFDMGDIKTMTGGTLVNRFKGTDGETEYVFLEIHEYGVIHYKIFQLEGSNTLGEERKLTDFEQYKHLSEEVETGYEGLLIEYIPNLALDTCFWGISDYYDLLPIFDAMNNRVSKIDSILEKHSMPKLILPPGIMQWDHRLQRWYVAKEDLEAIEVNPDQMGDLPRYLVWDAKLDSAFLELERLLDLAMMIGEVSPASFGLDKNGSAESGRALRYKLMRTISKCNRKKLYLEEGLGNIMKAALGLEKAHGSYKGEIEAPNIEWNDGLPNDPDEMVEREATRTSARLSSKKSAMMRLGLTEEDAEEEIENIKAEEEMDFPDLPEIDLEAGEEEDEE